MHIQTVYTLASVIIISLISLIGIVTFSIQEKKIKKYLLVLVSLSAGTLFGGALLHLLPEAVAKNGFTMQIGITALAGIVVFFVLEQLIHLHHHHHHEHPPFHGHQKPKHIGILNLFGDGVHNFLDGLIIAGSYMVSIPVGIATTIAVILHEVPQELADFGILLYAGFSKGKAIFYNFISATISIAGAVIGIFLGASNENFVQIILPFAAGGFIYIAGSTLIPELHKHCKFRKSLIYLAMMIVGILLMVGLKFIG